MVTIEGTVENIIYQNESNGYTVCDISCSDELVTAVGYMPSVTEGEHLKLTGQWTVHPDYGRQLKVETFEKTMPESIDEIEKFLASGVIKGVREATARKIVDHFGKDAISVIRDNPERLAEIKGISLQKALGIGQAFNEHFSLMNLVIFLNKFGIGTIFAVRIYQAYGKDAIEKIRENPYSLADDIQGIGFRTADNIAMSLGVEPTSGSRLRCGIKYILSQAASAAGHTYLPSDMLLEYAKNLLNVNEDLLKDALMSLQLDKTVYVLNEEGTDKVYLNAFYHAELNACKKLAALADADFKDLMAGIDDIIEKVEQEENIRLADLQRKAVISAIKNGVMVITGGPGTGKTTIIKTIIKILEKYHISFALAAPTGRAAKKMNEATGVEAKTIHRLLEIGYLSDNEEQVFFRNEDNPLDVRTVIIDEMSMVDILLFNNLLKALTPGTKLILVGDVDQLPSVGPGNVLKDIIESGVVETVSLKEIFRQERESKIVINAHKINNGIVPEIDNKEDFFFIRRSSPESVIKTIINLCYDKLPEMYGYDPMNDIQVLTPTKKGPAGVANLNKVLQNVMNPPSGAKAEKASHGFMFRVGDKVMQIKNNYSLKWKRMSCDGETEGVGVFNGDTGIITQIDHQSEFIEVLFDDDKLVIYDFSILDEIEPAYAVTIHKSQGSEFPAVIIPLLPGPPVLMTRNLLYTAVTRAAKIVILVGSEKVFVDMVNNHKEAVRYSGLKEKIRKRWELCLTGY